MKMRFVIFFSISILLVTFSNAQPHFLSTYKGTIKIEDKQLTGNFILFDFEETLVKKGLWQYCTSFGKLNNMKKYYEFSIASSEKKNSQKTVFFFKLEALDASTKVYIAPKKSANLSKSKNLLIDFKVHFLTAYYQDKITTVEKKMIKLDKQIVNSKSKELSVEMSELVRERNRYIQTLHAMQ